MPGRAANGRRRGAAVAAPASGAGRSDAAASTAARPLGPAARRHVVVFAQQGEPKQPPSHM